MKRNSAVNLVRVEPSKSDTEAGAARLAESAQTNALARELGQLATRNGLRGCVLISFTDDRVGVNSSGVPDEFGKVMESLADKLLCAIDDGDFDPQLTAPSKEAASETEVDEVFHKCLEKIE